MLKSSEDIIVVNDFVQGEPLSEENLDKTLNIVAEFNKRYRTAQDIVQSECDNHNMLNENSHEIRLLLPNKTIWLYTGYNVNFFELPYSDHTEIEVIPKDKNVENDLKRISIIKKCSVIVDGKYIDSQRDITLQWRGSKNQRVIDIKKSIEKGEVILWTT